MCYCLKKGSSTAKREGKARGKTIFMNLIEKSLKTLSVMCAHRNGRNESKLVIRNREFFFKTFYRGFFSSKQHSRKINLFIVVVKNVTNVTNIIREKLY